MTFSTQPDEPTPLQRYHAAARRHDHEPYGPGRIDTLLGWLEAVNHLPYADFYAAREEALKEFSARMRARHPG